MRDNSKSNSKITANPARSAVIQYIYRYIYKGSRRIKEMSEFPLNDVVKRSFPFFPISYLRYPKDVFVTLEPRVESRHFLNAPLELYDESRDNFEAHSNTDVPQVIYGDSDDSDDDMEPSFKARTI